MNLNPSVESAKFARYADKHWIGFCYNTAMKPITPSTYSFPDVIGNGLALSQSWGRRNWGDGHSRCGLTTLDSPIATGGTPVAPVSCVSRQRARRPLPQSFQLHCSQPYNNTYFRLRDQKALLEAVMSRDSGFRQELDGVPIEFVNDALQSRLPQEISVVRGFQDGSLWTTEEGRREVEAACRKRYRSPSRLLNACVFFAKRPWKGNEYGQR